MATVLTIGTTDQTSKIKHASMTLKVNTLDFTLEDPGVLPALADVVTVVDASTGLSWTGQISKVKKSSGKNQPGYKVLVCTATNEDNPAASAAPWALNESPSPPTSYGFRDMTLEQTIDKTGAQSLKVDCEVFQAGLWPLMTVLVTNTDLGLSATNLTVRNTTVKWPGKPGAPVYTLELGDPTVTMSVWLNSGNSGAFPIDSTRITDGAVTTPKVAANAITADQIAAGAITADKLAANLVLASLLQAGAGPQKVTIDQTGIKGYDANGNLVVNIPADGSDVTIQAHVWAQTLSVIGAAILSGASNEVGLGASLQLDAQQTDPSQAPILAIGWDSVGLPIDWDARYHMGYDTASGYSRAGLFYDPAGSSGGATKTFWTVTQKADGSHEYALELSASDRTVIRAIDLGPGGVGPGGTPYQNPLGVARLGSYIYVLTVDKSSGSGGSANLGQTGSASYSYVYGLSGGPNEWAMGPYTMPEHGTLTSITVDTGAHSSSPTCYARAVLWRDSDRAIVAQSGDVALNVGHGPVTFTMPATDLPSGSKYWIGVYHTNGAQKRVGVQNGGSLYYKQNIASPGSFDSPTNWGSPAGNMQAYLTYNKVTAVTSYVVRRYSQSTLALDATYSAVSFPVASPVTPQIAADGTNIFVVDRSSTIVWNVYDGVMAKQGATVDTTYDPSSAIFAAFAGSADFGAWRMAVSSGAAPGTVDTFTNLGARQTNEVFRAAAPIYGLTYGDALGDGARFWSTPRIASAYPALAVTKHSTWTWTTASSVYWCCYSWADTNATGGTHDTGISPRASVTMVRRAQLTITAQDIPGAGGTNDPNNLNFYTAPNATDPGATNFKRQAQQVAKTLLLTSYNSGGAADIANNYPGGTAGQIASQVGGVLIKGDGTMRVVSGVDLPGGVIACVPLSSNQGSITTTTDITGMTATWTAIAGRRYRIRVFVHFSSTVGTDRGDLSITDGSGTVKASSVKYLTDQNGGYELAAEEIIVPGAGSITRKARMARGIGTGTITVYAGTGQTSVFIVEDIGT